MEHALNPNYRVEIVPSETNRGCWSWVIRAAGGRAIAHSPYAFVDRAGARLSGECWRQEMIEGTALGSLDRP